MMIRRFVVDDAPRMCEIFYRSVHEVAWAPSVPDSDCWLPNLLKYKTFVAANDEGIVSAWISMTDEGYIDMLFCLPEAVGKGSAARLYATVERAAIAAGIQRLTAHASLLAQRHQRC
jgi:putative acetyltransferase